MIYILFCILTGVAAGILADGPRQLIGFLALAICINLIAGSIFK